MTIKIDGLLIGAPKSGTSTLAKAIAQLPGVLSHSQRELMYFVNDDEFVIPWDKACSRYFAQHRAAKCVFGKSVGMMYEKVFVQRLFDFNPAMKLYVICRDPIKRAYSAFWYARQRGWEDKNSFDEVIYLDYHKRPFNSLIAKRSCDYLGRGEYSRHLKNIFDIFPREQVHIWIMEDLIENPYAILGEVAQSLCINVPANFTFPDPVNESGTPHFPRLRNLIFKSRLARFKGIVPSKYRDRLRIVDQTFNVKKFVPPKMSIEAFVYLQKYYSDWNKNLEDLIRRDLSSWGMTN